MHVVRTAPIDASVTFSQLSVPVNRLIRKAPTTPTTAASVGLATPLYIEPKTPTNSSSTGRTSGILRNRSGQVKRSCVFGTSIGFGPRGNCDVRHETERQRQPGDDSRDKQLQYRDLGQDSIDDHHQTGWDQQTQRTGARE